MLRILFAIIVILHALIHLMGFLKAFHMAEIEQLKLPISKTAGIFWLLACLLLLAAAVLYLSKQSIWWLPGLAGMIISQVLIIMYWQDAKFGTIANVIILMVGLVGFGYWNFRQKSEVMVKDIMANAETDSKILQKEDISHLPPVVQKWLQQSKVVGKERAKSVYLEQSGKMRTKPDAQWWDFTARQWFTPDQPAFVWLAEVDIAPGVHLSGRDRYMDGRGHMLIKLLSLFTIVDASGLETDQGTLLRFLAETVWFPSAAVNPFIRWEQIDSVSAKATMTYGNVSADGIFTFDREGFVKSFEAKRYYDRKEGATLETWYIENVPGNIREFESRMIPTVSNVTWKLESGDYHWLKLKVEMISYNALRP